MIKFIVEMRQDLDKPESIVHTFEVDAVTHQQAARVARQMHPELVLLSTERAPDV